MSLFGYVILPRDPESEAVRRAGLDWHANVAQLSQLFCILAIPYGKLASTVLVNLLQNGKSSQRADGKAIATRRAQDPVTLFNQEVTKGCGTYGQWIFAFAWAAWMGYLCISDTAPDYLHLVKRFGVVGASQLPIHYLLSMKHPYAPLRFVLPEGSHRQLLSLHFVTGRLVILFVTIHAILYLSIFLQLNLLWASIRQTKIVVALLSLAIFASIAVTSLRNFRRRAHAKFYAIHLVGSTVALPLLYFHVRHIRVYILECGAIVGANMILRMVRK